MPMKKTYKKRNYRRRYKRRNYGKKRGYTLSKRQFYKLRNIHPAERKFVITSTAATAVNNAGASYRLNGMIYGTNDNTRIGDQIWGKQLTGNIYITGVTNSCRVRVMLYWVNLPVAGALPAITDLLETPTRLTTNRKVDFVTRFKMIRDWIVPIGDNGSSSNNKNIRISLPVKRLTQFSGDGVAAHYKNMLCLSMLSDTAGADPSVEFTLNYYYTDA